MALGKLCHGLSQGAEIVETTELMGVKTSDFPYISEFAEMILKDSTW
jgi:hypothetical protein